MHVVIINGSPRTKDLSNTEKIVTSLIKGMQEEAPDLTFERYCISNRKEWEAASKAFRENDNILIALPLYFECIPGLLLEFLSTLEKKTPETRITYLLQSGFAEASQLRCGESYLEKVTALLGCEYGGTLIQGDNFSLRFMEEKQTAKKYTGYERMGRVYAKDRNFFSDEAKAFAGPEYFNFGTRLMVGTLFKVFGRKMFGGVAKSWGCTKSLTYRPYN